MTKQTTEKFTPGPWVENPVETLYTDVGQLIPKEKGFTFYKVCRIETDNPLNKANTKLITAAPDLYAACKEFVRKVEAGEAKSTASYEQMKAAIKKATE